MSMLDADSENLDIGQIAAQTLAFAPPPIAQVIRLGAIPHYLSPDLLNLLAGERERADSVRLILNRLSLTHTDEEGVIHYHAQFRQALRRQLRLENPAEFTATNRTLYEYFDRAASQALASDVVIYEQEAFYHLLQFDAEQSLNKFRRQFETLISTGQVSQAEQYVTLASELGDEIGSYAIGWIDYWRARIELLHGHHHQAQMAFTQRANADRSLLGAVSTWGIGLAQLAEDRWSNAIGIFLEALSQLKALDDQFYPTHVSLSLGRAYQDFAEQSGGLGERYSERFGGQTRRLWDSIEQLPFSLYEGLAKRIAWLPTWNLGDNYQNWIIYYLLRQGRKWHRRAEKLATDLGDANSQFEAQRMLARLDLALGRTSRAIKRYEQLLSLPQIRTSKYRTAQTQLDLGLAHLDMGEIDTAETMIGSAITTLREFNDNRAVGCGMRYLGNIYARTGRLTEAADAYRNSMDAFNSTTELFEQTTTIAALEKLKVGIPDENETKNQIAETIETVRKRAYVTRFPDRLLQLFRRISLLVALPIAFLSTFLLTFLLVAVLFNLEGGVRLLLIGEPFDLAILRSVIMLIITISGFLAVVWIYHLVYTVVGAMVVGLIGRNLIAIEREQPIHYLVDDAHLQVHSGRMGNQDDVLIIPWSEIAQVSSLIYTRWLTPIDLYSTTRIGLKNLSSVDIPALTNHYTNLIKVIRDKIDAGAKVSEFRFSIFRSWFSVILIIVAFLLSVARVFTRELFDMPGYRLTRAVAEGHQHVPLWLTSVILFFSVSLLFLFQTVLLWRLFLHQNHIRRQTAYSSKALPSWLILILTLIATLLCGLWGFFLYSLTAGAA